MNSQDTLIPRHQFVSVEFYHFKAFKEFSLEIRRFNILVGPNNAGKSTVLAAFRILESAMHQARKTKPKVLRGPKGRTLGYAVDISAISVADENIFHNYDDSEPATVTFRLSSRNILTLYFPEQGSCILLTDVEGSAVSTPGAFRSNFNCPIGFVPILGPVEHHEQLHSETTTHHALFTYGAARNFRNIWYHYRQDFDLFRKILQQTWPGMDILPPELDTSHGKIRLYMYCPENRIPREIYWAGFGFQVWAQMLTHLIHASEKSLFLIDEPDIYLHSELQRLLLSQLRNLGPDILIATHSTEIMAEAQSDEIVLVRKDEQSARRIQNSSELGEIFRLLGSNSNPVLTQVAKTRHVLFVEGKDFQIIGRLAQRLERPEIGNRENFAVVPIDGFNPERVRHLKSGMAQTLGAEIVAAVILDRDYRSADECRYIKDKCSAFCDFIHILERKEIENFLLIPTAIDRAAKSRVFDRANRSGLDLTYESSASALLTAFSDERRDHITSRILMSRRRFERTNGSGLDDSTIFESCLKDVRLIWDDALSRLDIIPGKDALKDINTHLQSKYGISITPMAIVDAMLVEEVPNEIVSLINMLSEFVSK